MKQKYTAEQRRQIKKHLMFEQDVEWQKSVPKYAGNDSPEVVAATIKKAYEQFMSAAVDFQESDRKLLLAFVENNNCDMTRPETWFSAWQRIFDRLGVQSEPVPKPVPVAAPVPAERPVERNPFPVNSFEWHRRDRQIMVEDSIREISPLVRDTLQEISTASGLKIPQSVVSEMLECFDAARPRMFFNRENLRRCFIKRFFNQFKNPENVFTPEEIKEWHMDNFQGDAETFAKYFGLGNPGMRTSD